METHTYRILLVDDHPIIRHGLADLIRNDTTLRVCAEAGNQEEALEAARQHLPHLAVVDLRLKEGSGLDLIEQLLALPSAPKVLVCSMHDELLFAERCLRAGASGYIQKEEAIDRLLEAVHHVLGGRRYTSRAVSERIVEAVGAEPAAPDPVTLLSNREVQVFELLGEGYGTRDIAERLDLSPKTIETYRENIKNKLGVQSSTQLMQRAVQWVLRGQL
jgi:DNA-binding NarL/FixJ family response regulator